jgi:hypothetical protein
VLQHRRARLLAAVTIVSLVALLATGLVLAAPLGTSFTYQGQLRQAGAAVNGACDFQFSLFDAASGGAQVGVTQAASGLTLVDGRFTVQLDFGGAAFDGNARWLEIATRCPAGGGGFTTMAPRQPLSPSPYALFAGSATSAPVSAATWPVSPSRRGPSTSRGTPWTAAAGRAAVAAFRWRAASASRTPAG